MSKLISFTYIKSILLGESGIGKTPVKNAFNDGSLKKWSKIKILRIIYEVLFKNNFFQIICSQAYTFIIIRYLKSNIK